MKISRRWLEDFVYLPDSLTSQELADKLTLHTVEVEEVVPFVELLDNVVVGHVMNVQKHPDADQLHVCVVDIGGRMVQIVCGGSNVREGMYTAVACIGAQVRWHGEGEPVTLKKTKIRGVESEGMICAADEIGLGLMFQKEDEKEILDLSDFDVQVGTALSEALDLDDDVIDIDNKSMTHRPDLWGHYGMAREVASIFRKEFSAYEPPKVKGGDTYVLDVSVDVPADACQRYMAVALDNVSIKPSPLWMQRRLAAVGITPRNCIVDVTNYVMLDFGQPMHAFDGGQLKKSKSEAGTKIIDIAVRFGKKSEKLSLLDGSVAKILPDDILIASGKKAIAIGGVMGGDKSAVRENTSLVILEAATFSAQHIRKTAKHLGIRTDSSARFEKTLDPEATQKALQRAVQLILELSPDAKVVSKVADYTAQKLKKTIVKVPVPYITDRIGMQIERSRIIDILERLGFAIKEEAETLAVQVPSWRATKDISTKDDIVEEIARMYGYDQIESYMPLSSSTPAPIDPLQATIRNIQDIVAYECGFTEVHSYSFVASDWLGQLDISTNNHLELDNPVASDRPLLRRQLTPNLLKSLVSNVRDYADVRLFEIGRTYNKEESGERARPNSGTLLPRQETMIAAQVKIDGNDTPFYALRSVLDRISMRIGIKMSLRTASEVPQKYVHPGRSAYIMIGDTAIGFIGEMHPLYQDILKTKTRVAVMEFSINQFIEHLGKKVSQYTALAAFPAVERDISLVVPKEILHRDLAHTMELIDDLVVGVTLQDVYVGTGVPKGKKSVTYRIMYQSSEKTLTAKDVKKVHEKLFEMLSKKYKATMRDAI